MSQRVYEKTLAWLDDPAANDLPTVDRSDVDSKCQLIDGTPIHPLYGIAASITAKFRHTVYSARGRPIHDSYDTRSIPEWMKDIALVTSNGKCSNLICCLLYTSDAADDSLRVDLGGRRVARRRGHRRSGWNICRSR